MTTTAVYDTKPYDRHYLSHAAASHRIRWRFHEFRLNRDTVSTAEGADAVCVFVNDAVDRSVLEKLRDFRVQQVALRCAGFNNVDLQSARELGIHVTRVPAYSPHAVAEHAVGLLLTLNRKIHRAYNRVREHNFSLNGLVGFDLAGKTVGIVGTGKIGRVAARIFKGFETRVLAYDPIPNNQWAQETGVEYTDMDTLLMSSDILSLHVPLTKDTHHMVNKTTIGKMKQGAYIINTSRGRLIETTALIDALKSEQVAGVALDVYEEEEGIFFEDLSDRVLQDDELSRLLTFPNVLVTSHQAFFTREALEEIARVTAENLSRLGTERAFLEGTVLGKD